MSANQLDHAQQKLVTNLSRLLEKHKVHNEVLAIELAIFVLQREKTAVKDSWKKNIEALKTGEWKI